MVFNKYIVQFILKKSKEIVFLGKTFSIAYGMIPILVDDIKDACIYSTEEEAIEAVEKYKEYNHYYFSSVMNKIGAFEIKSCTIDINTGRFRPL